jgi:hypothetical protein
MGTADAAPAPPRMPERLPALPVTVTRAPPLETTVRELEEAMHPAVMARLSDVQLLLTETREVSAQLRLSREMQWEERDAFMDAMSQELLMRSEEQQAIIDDLIVREQDRSTVVLSLLNEVGRLRRFIYQIYGKETDEEN